MLLKTGSDRIKYIVWSVTHTPCGNNIFSHTHFLSFFPSELQQRQLRDCCVFTCVRVTNFIRCSTASSRHHSLWPKRTERSKTTETEEWSTDVEQIAVKTKNVFSWQPTMLRWKCILTSFSPLLLLLLLIFCRTTWPLWPFLTLTNSSSRRDRGRGRVNERPDEVHTWCRINIGNFIRAASLPRPVSVFLMKRDKSKETASCEWIFIGLESASCQFITKFLNTSSFVLSISRN